MAKDTAKDIEREMLEWAGVLGNEWLQRVVREFAHRVGSLTDVPGEAWVVVNKNDSTPYLAASKKIAKDWSDQQHLEKRVYKVPIA